MNILETIIISKKKEVLARKELRSVQVLEGSLHFERKPCSLVSNIRKMAQVGIIAEFKRKSPSKGVINNQISIEEATTGYLQGGAAGLSILTDMEYFGGASEDLAGARSLHSCPILRKDFIIDEYQIIEAKSIGADVILLIAAVLPPNKLRMLGEFAKTMGMEVLLEVHNEQELQKSINPFIDLLGVNNRNLTTFETNISVSKSLAAQIPQDFLKVSESGIDDPRVVSELMTYGFEGFLIGEHFMRSEDPGSTCDGFIKTVMS